MKEYNRFSLHKDLYMKELNSIMHILAENAW